MGSSHGDGFYRDSEVSIPIAYCIAPDGTVVLAARNDTRTRTIILSSDGRRGQVRTGTGKQADVVVK
ncbi:hypothetical protein BZG17_26315 [Escherichia coli]|nr:hypothetical protein [Escherichia coli]